MVNLNEICKNKTFIIAEIGKNFIQTKEEKSVEEYLRNAKYLVKLAKESGANAVKFQTHNYEDEQIELKVTSPHFKNMDRYSWVKKNTLITPMDKFWRPLKEYCDELGILFFSTPMSKKSVDILNALDVQLWKVGSADILDFPMIEKILQTGKPLLISSGMSTFDEINLSLNYIKKKTSQVGLFHCVSKYPCPVEELNLNTILYLKKKFPDIIIGFSDHSLGYESAVAAVALGAKIIEKHFSYDRNLWGSDHKVSMLPNEFKKMVESIRDLENNPSLQKKWLELDVIKKSLGSEIKKLNDDELEFRKYFRKSLIIAKDIPAGTKITPDLVYSMRPQYFIGGLPSEKYFDILGKKTIRTLKKYDPITNEVLENYFEND